jgi:glycolate oxidase iron-sulfur subunit
MSEKDPTEERKSEQDPLADLKRQLAYDQAFSCVQCGYCLPACPTYETMGKETHSPRGRINLVRMTAEGKLDDLGLLSDAIDKCLGCRACETACPIGVQYGDIFESAKHYLQTHQERPKLVAWVEKLLLKRLIPSKRALGALAGLLWLAQRLGLVRLLAAKPLARLLGPAGRFAPLLPPQLSPAARLRRPVRPAPVAGRPARRTVAFFSGCVMDAAFASTNRNSVRLLQAAGCDVALLPGETCCGALHAHAGQRDWAKSLAQRNIAAFERLAAAQPIAAVVNNAGGCGAMLVEYGHLLQDDPVWAERAAAFSAKVRDLSQLLIEGDPLPFLDGQIERSGDVPPTSRTDSTSSTSTIAPNSPTSPIAPTSANSVQKAVFADTVVTYQPSCHMTNVQRVTREPLALLRSIPGITLREMADKDKCCGSAGIYNLVNYEASMDILDVKMSNAKKTGAVAIVTTNPGCLLQMQLGIAREGLQDKMRAVHLADLLAEACGIGKEGRES